MLKKRSNLNKKKYQLDELLAPKQQVKKAYLVIERHTPKYQEFSNYICIWADRLTDEFVANIIASKTPMFYAVGEVVEFLSDFEIFSVMEDHIKPAPWLEGDKDLTPAKAKPKGKAKGKSLDDLVEE